jgi:hypothetical protein
MARLGFLRYAQSWSVSSGPIRAKSGLWPFGLVGATCTFHILPELGLRQGIISHNLWDAFGAYPVFGNLLGIAERPNLIDLYPFALQGKLTMILLWY